MPNRDQRRHGDSQALGKWLHVEDADGNPYDVYLRDISAKDEYEFMQMMQGAPIGLCDIFLKGQVSLVGIAGLIWTQRRRYEKKLTVLDVMKTVNMATIETMELHDPEEEEDEETAVDPTPVPSASGGASLTSSPSSEPSTG